MTPEEVLIKVIKTANKYNFFPSLKDYDMWSVHKSNGIKDTYSLCLPNFKEGTKKHFSINDILFSRPFAKAMALYLQEDNENGGEKAQELVLGYYWDAWLQENRYQPSGADELEIYENEFLLTLALEKDRIHFLEQLVYEPD